MFRLRSECFWEFLNVFGCLSSHFPNGFFYNFPNGFDRRGGHVVWLTQTQLPRGANEHFHSKKRGYEIENQSARSCIYRGAISIAIASDTAGAVVRARRSK